MRPKAEWAIDSEPIQARGIIVKQASAPISKSSFSWFLKKTIENKIKQANKQAKGKERKTNKQAKKKTTIFEVCEWLRNRAPPYEPIRF